MRVALLLIVVLVAGETAQSQPLTARLAGTWKLNVAKSQLHGPPPQSETGTVEASATDTTVTKYSVSGTGADGKAFNFSFEGKIDGAHYPLMSDGQEAGKIAWRRTGARELSAHEIQNDGITASSTLTLSADGKTMTIREHVNGKQGAYDLIEVWDKT
jgi:hypothetical protein